MGYFKAFVKSDSEFSKRPVTVCVRPVCYWCAQLYREDHYIVEDRPAMKFEKLKCVRCRKVRHVGGDLVDPRARKL